MMLVNMFIRLLYDKTFVTIFDVPRVVFLMSTSVVINCLIHDRNFNIETLLDYFHLY